MTGRNLWEGRICVLNPAYLNSDLQEQYNDLRYAFGLVLDYVPGQYGLVHVIPVSAEFYL
jgi:hypothetical protein